MTMKLFYSTFPTPKAAQEMARTLLKEKIVACVNIFPTGQSLYIWNGKITEEREVFALFKTSAARAAAFKKRFLVLHDYDVPTLVEISAKQKNSAYDTWMRSVLGA